MSWSDERVELLKKLWQDGLSASQIAAELGSVTRNAVIGKVHRLGLSGRAKTNAAPVQRQRKAVAKPVVKTMVFHHARGGAALAPVLMTTPAEEEQIAAQPVGQTVVVPMTRRVSIMELREGVCRWPLGDPLSADFAFCGNDCTIGTTYCTYHSGIAFQPSIDRRRDRQPRP
jgi:GcrA cell cycle regulator